MNNRFSISIIFPVSRSKNFGKALQLARQFENFKPGNPNIVLIEREEELLEKWEYFNLLFWRTVDWKGSAIEFEGQRWQFHMDKTRIFYALQLSKQNSINNTLARIKEVRRIFYYEAKSRINDLTILN